MFYVTWIYIGSKHANTSRGRICILPQPRGPCLCFPDRLRAQVIVIVIHISPCLMSHVIQLLIGSLGSTFSLLYCTPLLCLFISVALNSTPGFVLSLISFHCPIIVLFPSAVFHFPLLLITPNSYCPPYQCLGWVELSERWSQILCARDQLASLFCWFFRDIPLFLTKSLA